MFSSPNPSFSAREEINGKMSSCSPTFKEESIIFIMGKMFTIFWLYDDLTAFSRSFASSLLFASSRLSWINLFILPKPCGVLPNTVKQVFAKQLFRKFSSFGANTSSTYSSESSESVSWYLISAVLKIDIFINFGSLQLNACNGFKNLTI